MKTWVEKFKNKIC